MSSSFLLCSYKLLRQSNRTMSLQRIHHVRPDLKNYYAPSSASSSVLFAPPHPSQTHHAFITHLSCASRSKKILRPEVCIFFCAVCSPSPPSQSHHAFITHLPCASRSRKYYDPSSASSSVLFAPPPPPYQTPASYLPPPPISTQKVTGGPETEQTAEGSVSDER